MLCLVKILSVAEKCFAQRQKKKLFKVFRAKLAQHENLLNYKLQRWKLGMEVVKVG